MILHLATVYRVLPEKHGVLVAFRDLSATLDVGLYEQGFVRVGASRAHPTGGASQNLPEVGELGVVLELEGGLLVWLCALHWQDHHQIDPDPDLYMHRHASGFVRQIRGNGDAEWRHPSGLRMSVAQEVGGLPPLLRTGTGFEATAPVPTVELDHPSGLNLTIAPDGGVSLNLPSGGGVDFSADGAMSILAMGDLDISALGTARFSGSPNVEIIGSDTVNIVSMGPCNLTSSGPLRIESSGPATLYGFDAVHVLSETMVSVVAPALTLKCAVSVSITTPLLSATCGNVSFTAAKIDLKGLVAITGVGLVNGNPIKT